MNPTTWHDLIGWRRLKAYLQARYAGKSVTAPGELFPEEGPWARDVLALVGPSGIGKTSAARILAGELTCHDWDVLFLDAGKVPKVEGIRDLEERLSLCKWGAAWRVCIVDEAHNLTTAAKRALLGMLERLPPKTLVVFTATSADWLGFDGGALRRRCRVFRQRAFKAPEIVLGLRQHYNGALDGVDSAELKAVVEESNGNLGQALMDAETLALTGLAEEREG